MSVKLSIIIPAFNESTRFEKTLPQIMSFFRNQPYSKEIIIVDDGSTDNTAATVRHITKHSNLIKIYQIQSPKPVVQRWICRPPANMYIIPQINI